MCPKEKGKVWKIISENEKNQLHSITHQPQSKSSYKTKNFVRKIIPLSVDDPAKVIDRNIIIQRHDVFQKETQNAYNPTQLRHIYELLFKNQKNYHIQRKHIITTDNSPSVSPKSHQINNNNTSSPEMLFPDVSPKVQNEKNNCTTFYDIKSQKYILKDNYNDSIKNTFYPGMFKKVHSPFKALSSDEITFTETDGELKKNNETYLRDKMMLKLQKKFPFYKIKSNNQQLRLTQINCYNNNPFKSKSPMNTTNVYNLRLNKHLLDTYDSTKNVPKHEKFMLYQQYASEIRQHYSNCPNKAYVNFKNKTLLEITDNKNKIGTKNEISNYTKKPEVIITKKKRQINHISPPPFVSKSKQNFHKNYNRELNNFIKKFS